MPKASRKPVKPVRALRDSKIDARADRLDGIPTERLAMLSGIREQIRSGFYNTDHVLDDLSHSFTKAVDMLI